MAQDAESTPVSRRRRGSQPLEILYRDAHYVAVHKPSGMLVHRSDRVRERRFVLQRLRDQLGRRVHPVHRLDWGTSGVLLFALSGDAARRMVGQFQAQRVEKRYLALVRGFTAESGRIERPLKIAPGAQCYQDARTDFRRLATVQLPIPVARYPAARYSLIEARPLTGRRQQIRRHLRGESHPIVGDAIHGDGEHNRLFRDRFGIHRLILVATRLAFSHPFESVGRDSVVITTRPEPELIALFERFGWEVPDPNARWTPCGD